MGHGNTLTQKVDGDVEVVLGDGAELGLCLSVDEEGLSIAEYGHIVGRTLVVDVLAVSIGSLDKLDGLEAGASSLEVGSEDFALADTGVVESADALRQAGVTVLDLVDEELGLPAGLVGVARTVLHQVLVDELAGEAGCTAGGLDGARSSLVEGTGGGTEADSEDVLVGVGVRSGEEVAVVGVGVTGVV